MAGPSVRVSGVSKRFGAVTALDKVDLELAPGEVHGLLGENGAGKTTLARVVAGILAPDAGRVAIGGRPLGTGGVAGARTLGVAMVHQHFSLVPRFTGLDNIALFDAAAWTRGGMAQAGYRERVEARAEELGLTVALDEPVGRLGVVARQRVEILKALMGETRVLLLDEPTAVLAPQEVAGLFAVLRRLARGGTGIVLVAHKLDEVLAIADRVSVLRRGRRVLTRAAVEVSAAELAEAMVGARTLGVRVGDALADSPSRRRAVGRAGRDGAREEGDGVSARKGDGAGRRAGRERAGAIVAELRNVTVAAGAGAAMPLRGVNMKVRRGEIFGVAGVGGNGQRTLAAVLAGVRQPDSGEARLPEEVGWIPQDRTREGLVNGFTITENVALALHKRNDRRRGPWLDWAGVERTAAALVRDMDVRAESPAVSAGILSGGNQQRVVAGRELLRSGDLLVAESPTRGLDVKATREVRARLLQLVAQRKRDATAPKDKCAALPLAPGRPPNGALPQAPGPPPGGALPPAPGVVLISADLDEIVELSDRVAVMVRGRLIPLPPDSRDSTAIGELMLSARRVSAP